MRYKNLTEGNVEIWDVVWYDSRLGCVGVVVGYDPVENLYHGYIGVGDGRSEDLDVKKIVRWGRRLERKRAIPFFPHLKEIQEITDEQWKF